MYLAEDVSVLIYSFGEAKRGAGTKIKKKKKKDTAFLF